MQAEASSQDLDQRLKGVYGSEGVPEEERLSGAAREEGGGDWSLQTGLISFPAWCEPWAPPRTRAVTVAAGLCQTSR